MDPDRSLGALVLASLIVLTLLNVVVLAIQIKGWGKGTAANLLGRLAGRAGRAGRAGPAGLAGRPGAGKAGPGAGPNGHANGPFHRAVTTALSAADVDQGDQRIVHKAMAFSTKAVCDVMIPRLDMICVPANAPLRDILTAAGRSGHSRIPAFDSDLDHIVGFVHAKDLLKLASEPSLELTAREIMRPILAVPENKSVDDMLREFQLHKTHVAIVIDEFGGTSGIVTINDLLEELVGELFDEVRPGQPDFEALPDGTVRLSGKMAIVAVNEQFGLALPDDEFNTIAGLVFGCLGRTPTPGDEAEIDGARFRVEATNGRRATQIMLHRPSEVGPR